MRTFLRFIFGCIILAGLIIVGQFAWKLERSLNWSASYQDQSEHLIDERLDTFKKENIEPLKQEIAELRKQIENEKARTIFTTKP